MGIFPDVPYDIGAEQATLVALLHDKEAAGVVASWLRPEHFYLEKHAWVYEAIQACYNRREPPDQTNVTSELHRLERLDAIGGLDFFYRLFRAVGRVNASGVASYAAKVEQTAADRMLIHVGGEITALGYERGRSHDERRREAEEKLFAVGQRRRMERDFVSLAQTAGDVVEWLSSDEEPGLPLGLPDLDRVLGGGLMPGELAILAARPSVGKTALALTILYHVCVQHAQPAQFFSLEMSRRQLAVRLAGMHSGIDVQRIRPRRLRGGEYQLVVDALAAIALDDVLVDDTPCEEVLAMRGKARRAAATTQPALIVVDYLGLAEGAGENRTQQVATITRNLKAMARELNVPVLALAQLNRAVEGRASKIPMLSDLRDSGAVEQDADVVMFLHREDYYDKATENRGSAEVHIAKNRSGPLGVVPLYFDAPTTRFRSMTTYQSPPGYGDEYDHAA